MTLFAPNGLMDRDGTDKNTGKRLIRDRYRTLYHAMGVPFERCAADVNRYPLIDL